MYSNKHILFVSTNRTWGGSEVLWCQAAGRLTAEGATISVALHYQHHAIQKLVDSGAYFYNFNKNKRNVFQKITQLLLGKSRSKHQSLLDKIKPDLIVYTLGGLASDIEFLKVAIESKIPYLLITQLVGELHYLNLPSNKAKEYFSIHSQAIYSCFVSRQNMELAEAILGGKLINGIRVYNSIPQIKSVILNFPHKSNLNIAFVGRFDMYHKGLDVLVKIVGTTEWKHRDVVFNFYGEGIHATQLNYLIEKFQIKNIKVHAHVNSVEQIWKENHIGIFPSRMEGQSLALLEAISFGRTVIATDVGDNKELIDDNVNGFIASNCDESNLLDAMERAWQNKHQLEAMGRLAHKSYTDSRPSDPISHLINLIVNA